VKPAPFTYHRPRSLEETLDVLADLGEDGKVLAGGQSLVPLMSMRLSAPAHLVDVNHVPGLAGIEVDGSAVRVGALARHSDVEHHAEAYDAVPLLRQALRLVAHPTIRNRGTTVGSLVHGDPAAELPAVLLLLDGSVSLRSSTGRRDVEASAFFTGPMETALRAGELAVAATFRRPPPGSGTAFLEVARRHGDYAMCGVCALVGTGTSPDAPVLSARVALISMGSAPVLVDLEEALDGETLDEETVRALVDGAVDPETDIHASADYRRHLAHVLVRRALDEAREHAQGRAA
jgi:aerobic carbon-monoxide dehydrogenase medium subunit